MKLLVITYKYFLVTLLFQLKFWNSLCWRKRTSSKFWLILINKKLFVPKTICNWNLISHQICLHTGVNVFQSFFHLIITFFTLRQISKSYGPLDSLPFRIVHKQYILMCNKWSQTWNMIQLIKYQFNVLSDNTWKFLNWQNISKYIHETVYRKMAS